ncbi:hypothetical protein GQR58_008693 [Nymphon striatum]|nr:hypothetical protein GQR58_008693 [Nymphon striatum]
MTFRSAPQFVLDKILKRLSALKHFNFKTCICFKKFNFLSKTSPKNLVLFTIILPPLPTGEGISGLFSRLRLHIAVCFHSEQRSFNALLKPVFDFRSFKAFTFLHPAKALTCLAVFRFKDICHFTYVDILYSCLCSTFLKQSRWNLFTKYQTQKKRRRYHPIQSSESEILQMLHEHSAKIFWYQLPLVRTAIAPIPLSLTGNFLLQVRSGKHISTIIFYKIEGSKLYHLKSCRLRQLLPGKVILLEEQVLQNFPFRELWYHSSRTNKYYCPRNGAHNPNFRTPIAQPPSSLTNTDDNLQQQRYSQSLCMGNVKHTRRCEFVQISRLIIGLWCVPIPPIQREVEDLKPTFGFAKCPMQPYKQMLTCSVEKINIIQMKNLALMESPFEEAYLMISKAYRFLRKLMMLPSAGTLRKPLEKIKFNPGICHV